LSQSQGEWQRSISFLTQEKQGVAQPIVPDQFNKLDFDLSLTDDFLELHL
jgi:hypothetical protein